MAAPTITAENLNDLMKTTIRDLGEPKFTDIMTDIQEYYALPKLMDKNRVEIKSGTAVQWDVAVNTEANARNTSVAYATDIVTVTDGMVQANTPWAATTTNYAVDAFEIDVNREPRRIVDLVKSRRIRCMTGLTDLMEQNWWAFPSASDSLTPKGLPYWVTKNNTTGFNGGIPTGYTDVAGLSPTTYARWQNYTAQYTTVTQEDFIRKIRAAATLTDFKPPVEGIPSTNTGNKRAYYTNYSVYSQLEEALMAQNDDLGSDIASYDGKVMFRSLPVNYVPYLNVDTTGPFYGINWGVMKTVILRGWWLRQTALPIAPGQHTVSVQFLDCRYQFVCYNRRMNFVVATNSTYPS